MRIDFFARETHHREHARAVYNALPAEYQGVFTDDIRKLESEVACVFGYGDLKKVNALGKKTIYSDHGTGFFYNNVHPSYAGSIVGRDTAILRLSPNETNAARDREVLSCPIEVVGMPVMDKYAGKHFRWKRYKPTIAVSFHWDALVNPETRSAFNFYQHHLRRWKVAGLNIIGHGHPRIMRLLSSKYRDAGIKVVEDFNEVIKKADVYACDNSSTLFMFAFTKKPVVLLNCPMYRKNIEHKGNPRFWKYADIGPQVDDPAMFPDAVEIAIRDHDAVYLPRIDRMLPDIFAFTDGKCSKRAADAIIKRVDELYPAPIPCPTSSL